MNIFSNPVDLRIALKFVIRALIIILISALFSFILSWLMGTLSARPLQARAQDAVVASTQRFVANSGNDSNNDCREKSTPCKSVQRAVAVAQESDEIHVATGIYSGSVSAVVPDIGTVSATVIITKNIASLLGGYSADFASRNPEQNVTTLLGTTGTEWVIFTAGVTTQIDGFTLAGLKGSSPSQGGAIHIYAGAPTISHNRIVDNHSPQPGGGIYVSGGNVSIASNQIYSNSAPAGGGIYVLTGTVLITDNQIFGNVAQVGDGGGIYVQSGVVLIAKNTIAQNQAISCTTGRGGGIVVREGDLTSIRDNLIYANQSSNGGSAIEINVGGEIYGNILHHNQVLFAGSAVLIERPATPVTLANNLIYKNQGTGITARDFQTVAIINNTIHQNNFVSFGGPGNGIDINASVASTHPVTATIINNLLTNNAQCGIEAYNGVVVEIDYNAVANNKENLCNAALLSNGAHNLNVEPQYTDPTADNYRPLPTAPIVDKGSSAHATEFDLLGTPRPFGNGVDIGAIEAGAAIETAPAMVYLPVVQR